MEEFDLGIGFYVPTLKDGDGEKVDNLLKRAGDFEGRTVLFKGKIF